MIVLDASAFLAVLLDLDAEPIRTHLRKAPAHAPHLIDLEVAQTLRRLRRAGQLDDWRAEAALRDTTSMPLRRYPHAPLLPRVWQLRHTLTAYDAVYLALAESLNARLLTRDRSLASIARTSIPVEIV